MLLLIPCLVLLMSLYPYTAFSEDRPGVLKGQFIYVGDLGKNPITKGKCKPPEKLGALAPILTDIAVSLTGKVVESLVDAISAQTQPEATTLQTVIPLNGFYETKGVAVDRGCLVFHNGTNPAGADASVFALLQVVVSPDSTAFRFDVVEWKFSRFLKPVTSKWFQRQGIRDFALKVEFLSPGKEGLGNRSVFFEQAFAAVDKETVAQTLFAGQQLPWLSAPTVSADVKGLALPLNIKITLIETTAPHQFARWIQEIAKEKKTDISNVVKDAVRKALDPSFAALENAKSAEAAGTAYASYKSAWDAASAQSAAKPADLPAGATPAQVAAHAAAVKAWRATVTVSKQILESKKVAAKAAFEAGGLSWPGDLPGIPS